MNYYMIEFEFSVELMQREIARIRQLLSTLLLKKSTKMYQDKQTELGTFLSETEALLKRYHAIPLADVDVKQTELQREFFTQVDKLLQLEKWKANDLLQAAGQQLKKVREQLPDWEQKKKPDLKEARAVALAAQHSNMTQVFISLYQADGYNMKKWAALLEMMKDLAASRPIYQAEQDVRTVIRTKEQKQNEGYAAVYVSPKLVLAGGASGQALQDKSGYKLAFVKEGALLPEHMLYFEHISGRYTLQDGVLVRQGDSSFT